MTTAPNIPRSWQDLTQADCRSAEAIPLFRDLVSAMFKQPAVPAACNLFWQLFRSRVWKIVNGVAAVRQAALGGAYVISEEDREDVFQHTMAFLVSGIRYQPIRNRYSQRRSRLLIWMSKDMSEGRLIGFVSQAALNYAKDLFRGMVAMRLRAKEITHANTAVDDDDEENLIDLQADFEPELDFTERSEVRAWIRTCVDELSEPGRSLLDGVDIQGFTQSSIAAALGISEATASRAIRAARIEFIRRLREYNPELLNWFLQSTKRRSTGESHDQ